MNYKVKKGVLAVNATSLKNMLQVADRKSKRLEACLVSGCARASEDALLHFIAASEAAIMASRY